MQKVQIAIIVFFVSVPLFSQRDYEPNTYSNQLELRHDNDFFLLTDRYYSSGLYLTYRVVPKKLFLKNGDEQLNFRIGQEVYTPSQTQSVESSLFDRPYAGFTGLLSNWTVTDNNSLINVGFLIGLAGNNSGAGGFQRWYHRAIAISDSPLWVDELNNTLHLNLYAGYTKEWVFYENPFGVWFAISPKLAVGSRDIFGEGEAVVHFGRRNSIGESIAYNRIGNNSREIYFAFRLAYRQVLYNGLIEGNLFGNDSIVLRTPEASLLLLGFDFNHRFDKNDFKVGVRYSGSETPTSKSHIYLQLSYGLSF